MIKIIFFICFLVADQISKYLATVYLKDQGAVSVIGKKLQLTYVVNKGAAFGIFQNHKFLLYSFTVLVTFALAYYLIKNKTQMSNWCQYGFILIIAGAVGNLIDRLSKGFVVDFIMYTFFNGYHFPVFNIADIGVTLGCLCVLIASLKSEASI